ncbi:MAG: transcription elongation factor NusA [Candidatus Hydrothermarchaeales archaeon]
MEVAICEICLKRGILCPGCEKRLKNGEITQLDVEIAKLLHSLTSTFRGLRNLRLKRSIGAGEMVILVTDPRDVGALIGKGGKIAKILSERLDKKVRVVGDSKDNLVIARDLISPARVLGVNVLYPPNGKERYKVRVSKKEASRLPSDDSTLEKILGELTGKDIIISLE